MLFSALWFGTAKAQNENGFYEACGEKWEFRPRPAGELKASRRGSLCVPRSDP